jgi:signal transduction histidine kinase
VRKGGSGLGLVIAAELIRGHGGRLELLRTDDSGTVFAIRLPKDDISL